jgi:FixJ family two-component response regulator
VKVHRGQVMRKMKADSLPVEDHAFQEGAFNESLRS